MSIRAYSRESDTKKLLQFYNRQVEYAPFSVPLNELYLHDVVLSSDMDNVYFCISEQGEAINGIVHFGLSPHDKRLGHIYLLMGESTQVCMALLAHAEAFFSHSQATQIQCFPWKPNPYQSLLYGVEAYCWAGLYAANNAFRRMDYDVTLDIVVMSLSLKGWKEKEPVIPSSLTIEERVALDSPMALHCELIAYDESTESKLTDGSAIKEAGRSGYHHLKALSAHLGKGYGQIDIWVNEGYHGKNVGRILMETMHRRMFLAEIDTVILATNQGLFRAIKFYEGLGYRREAIRAYCYAKTV